MENEIAHSLKISIHLPKHLFDVFLETNKLNFEFFLYKKLLVLNHFSYLILDKN